MYPFLGTTEAEDLVFRIQIHRILPLIPACHRLSEIIHSFLFIRRIFVITGIQSCLPERLNDVGGSRLHWIPDGQINNI